MVSPLPHSVNTFDPNAEPLLYTTKGNIPLRLTNDEPGNSPPRLVLTCEWEFLPGGIVKCYPTWHLDGELVKRECNIWAPVSLTITSECGRIG